MLEGYETNIKITITQGCCHFFYYKNTIFPSPCLKKRIHIFTIYNFNSVYVCIRTSRKWRSNNLREYKKTDLNALLLPILNIKCTSILSSTATSSVEDVLHTFAFCMSVLGVTELMSVSIQEKAINFKLRATKTLCILHDKSTSIALYNATFTMNTGKYHGSGMGY